MRFEVEEAKDVQQHISRQGLNGAMLCLQMALLVCLESPSALFGAGSSLIILLTVLPDLGVAAHCIHLKM